MLSYTISNNSTTEEIREAVSELYDFTSYRWTYKNGQLPVDMSKLVKLDKGEYSEIAQAWFDAKSAVGRFTWDIRGSRMGEYDFELDGRFNEPDQSVAVAKQTILETIQRKQEAHETLLKLIAECEQLEQAGARAIAEAEEQRRWAVQSFNERIDNLSSNYINIHNKLEEIAAKKAARKEARAIAKAARLAEGQTA